MTYTKNVYKEVLSQAHQERMCFENCVTTANQSASATKEYMNIFTCSQAPITIMQMFPCLLHNK